MTEAEGFELALMAGANAITAFTVYITFTFGYLAAAYFVGKNLRRSQVVILSGLFIFSAMSAILAMMANLQLMGAAAALAPAFYPANTINSAGFWRFYMGILLGVGMLASLYFMWSARRSRDL